MKFIHTADWHLGKLFYGEYLTEEQEWILKNQFLPLIDEEKPDVILLAGDVYDRSVPPAEAVELFDEMISEITGKRKIPFIVISGNHDSAERLSFASRILRGTGLFLCGDLYHTLEPVVLKDNDGEVAFAPLPYAEPGKVREALSADVHTHEEAERVLSDFLLRQMGHAARKVAIAHEFVAALRVTRSGLFRSGGRILSARMYLRRTTIRHWDISTGRRKQGERKMSVTAEAF